MSIAATIHNRTSWQLGRYIFWESFGMSVESTQQQQTFVAPVLWPEAQVATTVCTPHWDVLLVSSCTKGVVLRIVSS